MGQTVEKEYTRLWQRWWYRISWTTLLPWIHWMYSYTQNHYLWKKYKNTETHQVNKKIFTLKWLGKADTFSPYTHPQHSIIQLRENSNSSFSLRSEGFGLHTWIFDLQPRNGPLKHLAVKTNKACVHETCKIIGNKGVNSCSHEDLS